MQRPSRHEWAMELAQVTAKRSTCLRRSVGCVLLDMHGHVIATGYNGVAKGQPHCNDPTGLVIREATPDNPGPLVVGGDGGMYQVTAGRIYDHGYQNACPGANAPSGTSLSGCLAIHAEQNALLQCRDVQAIDTCYCTASPCIMCCKMLLNTSCQHVIFNEIYPHEAARDLWVSQGRSWHRLTNEGLLV